MRAWRKHGVVPAAVYTGLKGDAKNYDHESTVYREIKTYLDGVKAAGAWNEEGVVATVRSILDSHLGVPPATVDIRIGGFTFSDDLATPGVPQPALKGAPDAFVAGIDFVP